MAVDYFKLIEVSGGASGDGAMSLQTRYSATFRVKMTDKLDTPDIVLGYFKSDSRLPWIGDPFQLGNGFDASVKCKSVDPGHIDKSDGHYTVKVEFESAKQDDKEDGKDEKGKKEEDPLKWHDEISTSYTSITVPCWEAVYISGMKGRAHAMRKAGTSGPVINSAGVPFDPTLEREVHIRVFRLTKNVPACNADLYDTLMGAVNTDLVKIDKPVYKFHDKWQPYTALIKAFNHDFQLVNGLGFYKRVIEVWVNPLGWREDILDQGNEQRAMAGDRDENGNEISPSDIEPGQLEVRKVKGTDGYPTTAPVLLNGDGAPLAQGAKPVFIKYAKIKEISYPREIFK